MDAHLADAMSQPQIGDRSGKQNPPATFHDFAHLPCELRLDIWEMAIQHEACPGVKYFTLFVAEKDHAREENGDDDGHTQCRVTTLLPTATVRDPEHSSAVGRDAATVRYGLSAPKVPTLNSSGPLEYSWIKEDRSAHTRNIGLWNTCRESRATLARYVRKTNKGNPLTECCLVAARDHGIEVLFPGSSSDLWCLDLDPRAIDKGTYQGLDPLIELLPLPPYISPARINVAFEFHSDWNCGIGSTPLSEMRRESSPRGLVVRLQTAFLHGEGLCNTTVWLIDREPHSSEAMNSLKGAHTFADEKDTFVEGKHMFPFPGRAARGSGKFLFWMARLQMGHCGGCKSRLTGGPLRDYQAAFRNLHPLPPSSPR